MGNYGAWSWGISHFIDGIEIVKARNSKPTQNALLLPGAPMPEKWLFAGAFDERIALTICRNRVAVELIHGASPKPLGKLKKLITPTIRGLCKA